MQMPEVDRVAASRAAVHARQERAELKEKLRRGELSALKLVELGRDEEHPAARLRVKEMLLMLPGIGEVKMRRVLEDLKISEKKRLGGLGGKQRARLVTWLNARNGVADKPQITVLAGPTAVGKGTVVSYLKQHYPQVRLSVSATTRAPRPGEIDGEHYYFVSDAEFDRMLAQNELLEWATVHGVHRYGTPKQPLLDAAAAGYLVLLEIDLQGARQVRAADPAAQLVFLAPPSWEELVSRLTGRGTESPDEQERRLSTAKVEMAAASEFDVVIVNDVVADAAEQLVQVMRGHS